MLAVWNEIVNIRFWRFKLCFVDEGLLSASMFRNQIGWNPLQMKGRFLSNGCNSPFCDLKILTLLLLLLATDLSTTWTEKGVFSWYAESHSGMDKINVAKGRLKESGHGYEVKIWTCHKMMPWKPLIYI